MTAVRRVRLRSTMWVPPCDCGVKPIPPKARLAAGMHQHERHERCRDQNLQDCKEWDHRRRMVPALRSQLMAAPDDARATIQRLLVTGDTRLKQGVAIEKVRESYLAALAAAREAGLEEKVRPLVELRLADLDTLEAEPPPPVPPAA